jgi:hypothetical protein
MKAKSIQGVVLAGAAAALLAGCGGERAEQAAPPPPPATVGAPVPPVPAVEPAVEPSTRAPKPKPAAPRPKPAPLIGSVSTTPALPCEAGWCTLPTGPGTVTFRAEVTGAQRVEFFLVPTGTDTWDLRRSLGVDRDGTDGWSVTWAYGDESLMHHLVVDARGPGGTVQESPINLVRE